MQMRTIVRPLIATVLGSVFMLGAAMPVAAFAGELDDTFDANGKLAVNFSTGADWFSEVAVQPADQKLVAVGRMAPGDGEWLIVRFNPDGSLDSGFGGGDGIVHFDFSTADDFASAVALQADGRIVVAGLAGTSGGRWAVVRLNADGTLDSSFSGDGKQTLDLTTGYDVAVDVAVQPSDQKILVTGYIAGTDTPFTVVRFTTTGSLDSAFSGDGKATANLTSGRDSALQLAVDSGGRVVVVGYASGLGGQIGMARFQPGGSLDPTFSGDGKMTQNLTTASEAAFGVAIQPNDDRIVICGASGSTNQKMFAARYNGDGTPDTSFSGDGRIVIDITEFKDSASGLVLQGDGKIVLAGFANYEFYTIVRLTVAGSLDTAFGDDGVMFSNLSAGYDDALGVAIQADGAIVAVGESSGSGGRASAARFLGN
jgi:uncharacterized delta-60 repeat protein